MTTTSPRDAWVDTFLRASAETADARLVADQFIAAGWRPPLPDKRDLRAMRSLIAGIIDGHFGDDYREQAEAAADEIIGRGWLDKVAEVGPPEPVATTLRRIIRDLESEAAGPQRHTHAGIALTNYALRLRGHPALDADADAGWPPLPDSETEKVGGFDRVKARIDEIQMRDRYALVNVNQLADLLRPDGLWSTSFAADGPATPEWEADRG